MFNRILILTLLIATACTPNIVQTSAPTQVPDVPERPTENILNPTPIPFDITTTPLSATDGGLLKKFTQIALSDLATRLNIDAKLIQVISTESMTWPNAALGCPLVDEVYSQGKVTGFRIRLEADGQVYDYHTDRTGKVVFCPNIEPSEPGLR